MVAFSRMMVSRGHLRHLACLAAPGRAPAAALQLPASSALFRSFSTGGSSSSSSSAPRSEAEEAAAAPTKEEAPAPAVRGTSAAASVSEKGVESIESLLIRSHREELIQKAGPGVERYLPTEDPNAFLLPASRLEPHERKWQKIFVAMPWLIFAGMLAVPLWLVRSNLPFLQQRAEEDKKVAEARQAMLEAGRIPDFKVVSFTQMPDVLERACPTMMLLFDGRSFAPKVYVALMRDLAEVFRAAQIKVAFAALDLSIEPVPPDFLAEYSTERLPHIQFILPRAKDGEPGVVDYDGKWSVHGLAEAAADLSGPFRPEVPEGAVRKLQEQLTQFRQLFAELVSKEDPDPKAARPGWLSSKAAREAQKAASEQRLADARQKAKDSIDFSQGLTSTIETARTAVANFGKP